MCGICGWITSSANYGDRDLEVLLQALSHRGPDDGGRFFDPAANLALGHRRLSIIDLSPRARQPMVNPNNGDVLVFNGEIYNFRELRSELIECGIHFRSHSDTEVLLMAIQQWGMDCIHRVRGMFAFALWQAKQNLLYLVRDPMGIKPLYYWCPPSGGLVFASEVKAFLKLRGFPAAVDARALGQFLEFGYCFEPERSIFEGVRRLPPGHILRAEIGGRFRVQSYFSPELLSNGEPARNDLEDELFETLKVVVKQHLIADVKVGLLLSGGLDSSLIASIASQYAPISTVSMGFAQSHIDERTEARSVASFIGSEHTEMLVTPEDVVNSLSDAIPCFDDLFSDWGTVTTRLLYKKCREQGIKVVLTGEGADEIFGGYDIFRLGFSKVPTDLWLFQLYRRYAGRRHGDTFWLFRSIMREYLHKTKNQRFDTIRLFESRNQLPSNYIMKVDKASMSVGVEARVPYLDQRVAEIAYRVPQQQLLSSNEEKKILRNIATDHQLLPIETIKQRKFGASIASNWMQESAMFRRFAGERILGSGSWTSSLGLRDAMEQFFVQNRHGYPFPHGISIFSNLAWRLLLLEMWSESYGLSPNLGGR
jgi:asparagine synthase (glutamine-hydrolysing)